MSDSQFICHAVEDGIFHVVPLVAFTSFAEPVLAEEWKSLQAEFDSKSPLRVVVDLSALPYFGSTVLEWILLIWRRVRESAGALVLLNPSPVGREVLEVARFSQLWPIVDTKEEALRLVRASAPAA